MSTETTQLDLSNNDIYLSVWHNVGNKNLDYTSVLILATLGVQLCVHLHTHYYGLN